MNVDAVEILIVEDNPADLEMTLRALSKHNLVNMVHSVIDGEEALDFIFAKGKYSHRDVENGPKVVFLDLKLPKMNGLEVLQKMKADERTKTIPVVVVTSSNEEPDIKESYKLGVNSYVVKPVDFDNFQNAIAELGLYWMVLNKPPIKA